MKKTVTALTTALLLSTTAHASTAKLVTPSAQSFPARSYVKLAVSVTGEARAELLSVLPHALPYTIETSINGAERVISVEPQQILLAVENDRGVAHSEKDLAQNYANDVYSYQGQIVVTGEVAAVLAEAIANKKQDDLFSGQKPTQLKNVACVTKSIHGDYNSTEIAYCSLK